MTNRENSWFVLGVICKDCGEYVKACDDPENKEDDNFEWFCVNELCKNNQGTKSLNEDRMPTWAIFKMV